MNGDQPGWLSTYTDPVLRLSAPLSWTILRNNLYTDFVVQGLAGALASGALVATAGDGAVAYVTREDCARAAAAALAADDHERRVLDITGPAALTQTELAALASEFGGRPVRYTPVDPATQRARLAGFGVPAPFVEALVGFDLAAALGHLAVVSRDFQDLTGRPPTSVAEHLRAHRAALAPAS